MKPRHLSEEAGIENLQTAEVPSRCPRPASADAPEDGEPNTAT
jgi:hypothetical protein